MLVSGTMASSETPIYFDNQATTQVDPRVLQAMLPTLGDVYGNPSSEHPYGWRARALVERARELTSRMIGAATDEIEFTSGATDSIQRALLGVLPRERRAHIITGVTEHRATLDACAEARRLGHDVTLIECDREGRIELSALEAALRPETVLVSFMHGNNEIGTLHPIREIGTWLRHARPDVYFHVDAAQTAGRHEIDVDKMNIDLLSLSAHKFHGPKGVGALYKRSSPGRRVQLHERHHGTANVPGIVGLGAACEIAHIEGAREAARLTSLRDTLIESIFARLSGVRLNGARLDRLCNNVSFTFDGVEPDQLMLFLREFAYSSASACTGPTQSHVLTAIGLPKENPFLTTVRFGLSRFTREEDVSLLIERLLEAVPRSREISGTYGLR